MKSLISIWHSLTQHVNSPVVSCFNFLCWKITNNKKIIIGSDSWQVGKFVRIFCCFFLDIVCLSVSQHENIDDWLLVSLTGCFSSSARCFLSFSCATVFISVYTCDIFMTHLLFPVTSVTIKRPEQHKVWSRESTTHFQCWRQHGDRSCQFSCWQRQRKEGRLFTFVLISFSSNLSFETRYLIWACSYVFVCLHVSL